MKSDYVFDIFPSNWKYDYIYIHEQLGWESLHKRRKGSKLILLFKDLKGRASVPCDDLQPLNRGSRNQHRMSVV